MQTLPAEVTELDYNSYQSRQYEEISRMGLENRSASLRPGGRASWDGKRWTPVPYPGFAMQAMLQSSANRDSLCLELQDIQHRIVSSVERAGALYPLPPSSFHQTVANTFSDDRLRIHLVDKGLENDFPKRIERALASWRAPEPSGPPPAMRLIGVSLFRTAVGLLGVFEKREHFERIIRFRNFFYGAPELVEVGLRRTRPFIGHVTLAYLESDLTVPEKQQLIDAICSVNERIRARSLFMEMPSAALHRYDDLSRFIPHLSYPQARI